MLDKYNQLSQQARVLLVTNLVILILTAVLIVLYKIENKWIFLLSTLIVGFVQIAISVYSINCYSKGQCEILAWIMTVINLMMLSFILVFRVFTIYFDEKLIKSKK